MIQVDIDNAAPLLNRQVFQEDGQGAHAGVVEHVKRGVDVDRLAAHIDVFPTFAELAGVKVPGQIKLDGRSLLPLLQDRNAPWPDRYLFTHVGRWEKGKAAESQYALCAVRTSRFRLVNGTRKGEHWELHDIKNDPGEKNNVIDQFPNEFRHLKAAYDRWWQEVQPALVNENVVGPRDMPFHVLYRQQFGEKAR